jgi:S1-C subfamily serine protease
MIFRRRAIAATMATVWCLVLGYAGQSAADERTDRLKAAARTHVSKPYLAQPHPCDDGWLAAETGHITDITPWAEVSGLRRGDRLVALGGILVSEAGHWGIALSRVTSGSKLEIVVERQGAATTLQLPCRSNREAWNAEREIFDAILSDSWDRCIAATQAYIRLLRRPFVNVLRLELECLGAKVKSEKTPATSPLADRLWGLMHRVASADLEASKYKPGRLSEIRSGILNAAEILEKRGRKSLADDLRQQLSAAAAIASAPPPEPIAKSVRERRSGTAFAVRADGLLLTAHHVIDGAETIQVKCPGHSTVPAFVEASSPTVDLAVLKINVPALTFLALVKPASSVPLGAQVFTVGYPAPGLLGVEPKFTEGVVSGQSGPGGDASFLQISVQVQPGNSGGPLVNAEGDVVGVVIASASASAFLKGTGALPQNINWAVKAANASALVPGTSANVAPRGRAALIDHVTKATCMVVAEGMPVADARDGRK